MTEISEEIVQSEGNFEAQRVSSPTSESDLCEYLVRVRAQVMSHDDSYGGWVPLGGGGMSNVSVRKKPRPQPPEQENPKHDYLILGTRIGDDTIVLCCTIKRDFEYNKVMPTFHHWRTGDQKFGLTFQAAADARAFDKGVRLAVEELLNGFMDSSPTSFFPKRPEEPIDDDEVFMTLELPIGRGDSRSSSDSSAGERAIEAFHKPTYIERQKSPIESQQAVFEAQKGNENYPYVELMAMHDYIYPLEESSQLAPRPKPMSFCRKAPSPQGSFKKTTTFTLSDVNTPPPKKTSPTERPIRHSCRHCNEAFTIENNPRGACEFAPDPVDSAISTVTCVSCVECAMYHCASDAEGEFAQHPCNCTNDDTCTRRWACLSFLACLVPCLWCYPPLKLCHWCGVKCGVCGARHAESNI